MKLGEYRAVIFAEPARSKAPARGLSINSRIGVTVYVRHGDTKESLTPDKASFDANSKELYLLVKNTGNVTVSPKVRWELKQEGGNDLRGEISSITVIAEGSRNIAIAPKKDNVKQAIPSGKYQLVGSLSWGSPFDPIEVPFNLPVTIP
jgi:hypothetical protein